ncbi:2-oxoacid:acceptor oxidoreductase family protein [Desulfobacca acetoxidans]|uniref:Pyruvate/ketoisovalerate oxidoreductase, gamma subunit n=1 Tax=Desulfobacca acetoxidans (strain ATCC 700848 / DSM 11109 / ASRB2) TaxID=880072 RepID=F2NHM6_DESAR|nr:2-oxoacid:acceptor oxidoreductase family protein [Desulfobacca acetoxidans]AEB09213.1 pyruvate/ketoisovalerate oxidoreductase, gamma subunit [Desulfobacca acetoxidans DSM 11109]HAY22526.1 pyruvate synthase [Desulfobacterales bacterium]
MLEIRFHGRGGQGAVTSVELLAVAAIEEGKFAQGFPSFGPERRGAPVLAFLRIDDHHIRLRCKIANPDVVLILDPSLIRIQNPAADLKPEGVIVLNTNKSIADTRREFGFKHRLAVVDANQIARQVLGVPITNTTMLGALIRATGAVKVDSMTQPLKERFGPMAVKNITALQTAFEKTVVGEAKS